MIIKRSWTKAHVSGEIYRYTGWFLFGIIPLYVVRGNY